MSGKGVALVCAIGSYTQMGKAEEKLTIEDEQTPLQEKLEVIATLIGKIGMAVALGTFIFMTLNMCITTAVMGLPFFSMATLKHLVDYVIIAITVVVVAVPEGLPLAVTISLAFSVQKMKEQNNLVRRLEASETMGGADQVCTDKTGTLTENKMEVKNVYIAGMKMQMLNSMAQHEQFEPIRDLLYHSICSNVTARIETVGREWMPVGNPTECGLLAYMQRNGENPRHMQQNIKELMTIPFSSSRKRATTVV